MGGSSSTHVWFVLLANLRYIVFREVKQWYGNKEYTHFWPIEVFGIGREVVNLVVLKKLKKSPKKHGNRNVGPMWVVLS